MLILSMHVSCNQPEQSQPEQSPIQGTFHSAFVSRPSLPPTCLPWIGPLSPPAPVVTFLFSLSPDVPCRCAVVSPPRSAPPGVSHPVFHLPLFFISHLSGPLAHSTARKKKMFLAHLRAFIAFLKREIFCYTAKRHGEAEGVAGQNRTLTA